MACHDDAPATTFEPDSIVCVVQGPLAIRSKPGADSPEFDDREIGQLLFVIDGPVEGSGSTWYLVQGTPGSVVRADGWVAAAGSDGTPTLAPATIPCATDPSLQDLAALDLMQRLHCYHAREFTFTDTVIAGAICGDGIALKSPAWMAGCLTTFWWSSTNTDLIVAIPPGLEGAVPSVEPGDRFVATITAHMDDPVARTCVPYEGMEVDYSLLNPGTILACRGMFVATSVKFAT